MGENAANSRYVNLTKEHDTPVEEIRPGELNQPVRVPQLEVRKCNECGQALPESYETPANEPWTTGIFGCGEDTDSYPETAVDPLNVHIPEELSKHMCYGYQQLTKLLIQKRKLEARLETTLEDWNLEFVKVKFMKDEYGRRLISKANEVVSLENQLAGCQSELATMSTSLSLQQRKVDSGRMDLIETRAEIRSLKKDITTLQAERNALVVEKQKLTDLLAKRETEIKAQVRSISIKAVEDFKSSLAYSKDIQKHVRKARNEIFDVEVKDLERQSLVEGFVRGFLKGIRLMHRRTGASIEGLSPSQASQDPSVDSGDDIESDLRKTLSGDDEEDVDII